VAHKESEAVAIHEEGGGMPLESLQMEVWTRREGWGWIVYGGWGGRGCEGLGRVVIVWGGEVTGCGGA